MQYPHWLMVAGAGADLAKVSGQCLRYSRFREPAVGDRVRSPLRGGVWQSEEAAANKSSLVQSYRL
jgi:hypothetical protein